MDKTWPGRLEESPVLPLVLVMIVFLVGVVSGLTSRGRLHAQSGPHLVTIIDGTRLYSVPSGSGCLFLAIGSTNVSLSQQAGRCD